MTDRRPEKMHSRELHYYTKYNSKDQVKEDEMGRACRTHGKRIAYRVLVGKPERKRPLGRLRHRREDIIKWIWEKYDAVDWTGFIWLRIGTSGGLLTTLQQTFGFN
jgi:hypothetical protein